MMELGPFRVNSDGTSLSRNDFAWNKVANVIFLESPAGVGFSYSNTTSDYDISGDTRTAQDSYTFLINWLERFPEYKTREFYFYIAGESYAGHYVPQLAYTILVNNKNFNQTVINLKGIALGNAWVDDEETTRGKFDYWWMHNLIPDEIHDGITSNCNFSLDIDDRSSLCNEFTDRAGLAKGNFFIYNIYAPFCGSPSNSTPTDGFDPCSKKYIISYLNLPQVQEALHANTTFLPYPWDTCSSVLGDWKEWQTTILPTIKLILDNNIRVWIYSGDIDGIVPVTSSTYSIKKLNLSPNTSWYSWFVDGEIGGYTVGYQEGLVFATVRGAGHYVPSYQPDRVLKLFESFIEGEPLPP